MNSRHQRLNEETTKIPVLNPTKATVRTSAGPSVCAIHNKQSDEKSASNESINTPQIQGRWLSVARAYLCAVPGMVAASTFWLCFHFFQSIHQLSHLGLTIIAVTTTTTIAVINVVGCWSAFDRFTSNEPTPAPTQGQAPTA